MRLSDDFDDNNSGLPMIYMAIGVALFVITVFGVVVLANRKPSNRENTQTMAQETEGVQETEEAPQDPLISGSTLTSDDLDFWHMYDEENRPESEKKSEETEETEAEPDPSTDGKHTKLVAEDGTEEWVSINPYLTKNTYDLSGLVYQYPIMKYYEDSEKVSSVGVRISADDGDINFKKLKKAGVDFAMTALFVVIFLDQWKEASSHLPALIGLASSLLFLFLLGPDRFMLPSLAATTALLIFLRPHMKDRTKPDKTISDSQKE